MFLLLSTPCNYNHASSNINALLLAGLQSCQEAYNPYPNALLSLRFVMEVGKIILADSQLEPGDVKEGDRLDRLPVVPKHNLEELSLVRLTT